MEPLRKAASHLCAQLTKDAPDAPIVEFPAHEAPLLAALDRLHASAGAAGRAVVVDLVWNTAPTPALLRAFSPAPGREKVRPIEGFEMHLEHAGFVILAKRHLDKTALAAHLDGDAKAAVEGDDRGAARLVAWLVRPA